MVGHLIHHRLLLPLVLAVVHIGKRVRERLCACVWVRMCVGACVCTGMDSCVGLGRCARARVNVCVCMRCGWEGLSV